MIGKDGYFGTILAVVYRSPKSLNDKLSCILISSQGTSGFVDMTLDSRSRYYTACQNLPAMARESLVTKALAIGCLRMYSTLDPNIAIELNNQSKAHYVLWNEARAAGITLDMNQCIDRYPSEIGQCLLELGVLEPKYINTAVIDMIYEDLDTNHALNDEIVYLIGDQLDQLFDPLAEYSPEPTEELYSPPGLIAESNNDSHLAEEICGELYSLQSNFRSDLITFLQEFLVPLRVRALGGELGAMTISDLNSIFPPTIDEVVRINNIFFEALHQALPYGSFEVLKACGMSIPYFYKACMRHETATKNFARNLANRYSELVPYISDETQLRFTVRRIESVIHCSLHLTRVKMVLDRLVETQTWAENQLPYVDEYYQLAVGTIDAFGRIADTSNTYDRRIFTKTGKILVELASQWPKELEYGWINRRVVSIFDAVDLKSMDKSIQHIVIIFTDQIVILAPTNPIPMKSISGFHRPSISDILMHSMVNEIPIQNLPDLHVVGYAPIEITYMAKFSQSDKRLAMMFTGPGMKLPAGGTSHMRLYQLIRPDHTAENIVTLITKAKIMNKAQSFHLFQSSLPHFTMYSTVHEAQGYEAELKRSPVGVFMNFDLKESDLGNYGISAAIGISLEDEQQQLFRLKSYSILGYQVNKIVKKQDLAASVLSNVCYYYTLYLSTANESMAQGIVHGNQEICEYLQEFVNTRSKNAPAKGKLTNKSSGTLLSRVSTAVSKKATTKSKRFNMLRLKKKGHDVAGVSKIPSPSPKATALVGATAAATVTKGSLKEAPQSENNAESEDEEVVIRLAATAGTPEEFRFPPRLMSEEPEQTTPQIAPVSARKKSFSQLRTANIQTVPSYGNIASDEEDDSVEADISQLSDDQVSTGSVSWSTVRSEVAKESELLSSQDVEPLVGSENELDFSDDDDLWYLSDDHGDSLNSVELNYVPVASENVIDDEQMSNSVKNIAKFLDDYRVKSEPAEVPEVRQITSDLPEATQVRQVRSIEKSLSHLTVLPKESPAVNTTVTRPESNSFLNYLSAASSMNSLSFSNYTSSGANSARNSLEVSIANDEDFAYLGGLVQVPGMEKGLQESESQILWPTLRDSSIVFLGSYVHSRESSADRYIKREDSIMQIKREVSEENEYREPDSFDHVKKETDYEGLNFTSENRDQAISEGEWLSSPGLSSTRTSEESTQIQPPIQIKQERNSISFISDNVTVFPRDDNSSSTVDEVITKGDVNADAVAAHDKPGLSASHRLLRYSSENTLQLASFTVQLDQLIDEECDRALQAATDIGRKVYENNAYELVRTKNTLMELYEKTRRMEQIQGGRSSLSSHRKRLLADQEINARASTASTVWVMITIMEKTDVISQKLSYMNSIKSILNMEWCRRDKV